MIMMRKHFSTRSTHGIGSFGSFIFCSNEVDNPQLGQGI